MADVEKKSKRYPTDLTDEEWVRIEPFLPGAAKSGWPVDGFARGFHAAAYRLLTAGSAEIRLVWIVAMTDMPDRNRSATEGSGSNTIFTGMRCTTLVKLPVALSGGQQRKLCAGSRRPAINPATQHYAWEGIHRRARGLTNADPGHLCLLEVGDDPNIGQGHQGDHLGPSADVLASATWPWPTMPSTGAVMRAVP